jgi:hypothetical protein
MSAGFLASRTGGGALVRHARIALFTFGGDDVVTIHRAIETC